MFPMDLALIDVSSSPLIVIAVGLEKPGNLGSILRSADAAGANGVVISDETTDIFNPNVVRASLGTIFSVPIAKADSRTVFKWSRLHQVTLVAATPESQKSYTEVNFFRLCWIDYWQRGSWTS